MITAIIRVAGMRTGFLTAVTVAKSRQTTIHRLSREIAEREPAGAGRAAAERGTAGR
jgi:hypothetical protein